MIDQLKPAPWPKFSRAQSECVQGLISTLGHTASDGEPSPRVVSVRSGFVILLTHSDGYRELLKVSPEGSSDEVQNEYRILAQLGEGYSHRVRAYVYARGTAALVLDWVEAESLSSHWESNRAGCETTQDVHELRQDLRRIGAKLDALHACGVVHGDLQPTHIRFEERGPTFIDFGVSAAPGTSFGGGLVHYSAPEYAEALVSGRPARRSEEGDWYALIASAFVSLTGVAPVSYPEGADRAGKLSAIAAQDIRRDNWAGNDFAAQLARALLLPPADRRSWVVQ